MEGNLISGLNQLLNQKNLASRTLAFFYRLCIYIYVVPTKKKKKKFIYVYMNLKTEGVEFHAASNFKDFL